MDFTEWQKLTPEERDLAEIKRLSELVKNKDARIAEMEKECIELKQWIFDNIPRNKDDKNGPVGSAVPPVYPFAVSMYKGPENYGIPSPYPLAVD